jgi:hypothetical protein
MTAIAIIHSGTFGADNQTCFSAGLSAGLGASPMPSIATKDAQGIYRNIRGLIRQAITQTPSLDLIVTAGGLIVANAAEAELTQGTDPQFVFLSGVIPPSAGPKNSGGASLNVPVENMNRRNLLTSRPTPVPSGNIYLVVNNNAAIRDLEIAGWTNVARFFASGPSPDDNTNDTASTNNFIAEFRTLAGMSPTPLGLVISPSPYFRHWRSAFTKALAHVLPVPVCYPFQDFVVAAGATNPGNNMSLNRPFLSRPNTASAAEIANTAYYRLGLKAGTFLARKTATTPRPNVGKVQWDGTNPGSWVPVP